MIDGMANNFDTQVALMKLRRTVGLRIEPHPFNAGDEDPSGSLAEVMRSGVKVA
jgi:hypothetical protein